MNAPLQFDVVVLGAGAAGLMCAIEAGKRGRRVALIEHNDAVGKKIRISGGGRCNFTNLYTEPKRFISNNPRFCHSALARYTPNDFIAFVEKNRIAYHEKKLGQLFCDGSAQQIIDALVDASNEAGVQLYLSTNVREVQRNDKFRVATDGSTFESSSLVVATGGLSIPKLGAGDFGYRLARQFGVPIIETRPGLVPFTLPKNELDWLAGLSGVSFDADVQIGKTAFRENVLITHRGLSGPAILQISSYWKQGESIGVDAFPDTDLYSVLIDTRKTRPLWKPRNVIEQKISNSLARRLSDRFGWERPLAECSDKLLREIDRACKRWQIAPAGTEGYAKAEVTRGGVDTRALNPKTMESKDVPGLYFIGEVVDVTGWLGGYNFQWAWSSGYCAGQAV